jgi:hypothetical protein
MAYESTQQDRRRALILGVLYILLAIALGWMLFKIWPPTPWPTASQFQKTTLAQAYQECGWQVPSSVSSDAPAEGEAGANRSPAPVPPASIPIRFYANRCINTTFDERLILLVIVAGILGSFVHGATSLADYIGNDNFHKNWTWFYLLRPPIGMALALVFYFVIRGGFLTTSGGAQDINPYGIAALAGLVGMFSKQATDKLSEVFSTLFRAAEGEGDDKRKDPLKPKSTVIAIEMIEPEEVKVGSTAQSITVKGENFVQDAQAYLDDNVLQTTFESSGKLVVQLADSLLIAPGTFKFKVVNPDKTESAAVDFRVIEASGTEPPKPGAPNAENTSP